MRYNAIYRPLTATPFKRNSFYTENPPSKELQSYIRCYWGTENSLIQIENDNTPELVIPDTCVDIIYHIDYTDNIVTGGFCGVNDCSFHAHNNGTIGHTVSTFAIRFYAWSAYAFCDDSLQSTMNGYFDVGSRFEWLDKIIRPKLLERLFHEYVGITPKKLSNLIRYQFLWRDSLCEPDFDVLSAVYKFGYTDQSHLLREFKRYHGYT